MRKLPALALVLLACWTADVRAVEIKNVRATYGPFGAPRPGNQVLPGDLYLLNFDVTGLNIDARGVAKYEITLEVFDPKGKSVFKQSDKKGMVASLGGNTVPESAQVLVGVDQPPGKYKAVVSILEDGSKMPSQLVHDLDLVPRTFGMIFLRAPATGLVGEDYKLSYYVVDMARDANQIPKLTFTTKVIDEATGKQTLPEATVSKFPDDLPAEARAGLAKTGPVPIESPMLLNRAGRFKVEVEIRDEVAKKSLKFSYSLKVLDSAGK
jgi:hypothetical protein